jgi:hypothetical protein
MKRASIEGLKHNTKLDVRLPDQLKDEFLARCRAEGVSSGAVIRSMIIDYVFAQPRRLPVMAAGLKEMLMTRIKWVAGGVSAMGLAALTAMGLVFPPLAAAEEELAVAYRIVVRDADQTAWRVVGRLDRFDGEFQVLEFPNENLRIAMLAMDCATAEIENCAADQAHIELDVRSIHADGDVSPRIRSSARMIVRKGQSGSIDTSIGEGLRFDAVLTPID